MNRRLQRSKVLLVFIYIMHRKSARAENKRNDGLISRRIKFHRMTLVTALSLILRTYVLLLACFVYREWPICVSITCCYFTFRLSALIWDAVCIVSAVLSSFQPMHVWVRTGTQACTLYMWLSMWVRNIPSKCGEPPIRREDVRIFGCRERSLGSTFSCAALQSTLNDSVVTHFMLRHLSPIRPMVYMCAKDEMCVESF